MITDPLPEDWRYIASPLYFAFDLRRKVNIAPAIACWGRALMPMKTPESIRSLRRQLGLSQEELAERLGVSFSTVNRWERGHRSPTRLALLRLDSLARETRMEGTVDGAADEEPEVLGGEEVGLWALVLRDRLLILDGEAPDLDKPWRTISIEPDLGPLRSIRQERLRGEDVLLVGAREGVWRLSLGTRVTPPVRYPFGSGVGERFGVNAMAVAHGHLFATHSERGLVRWNLDHPANAERLFSQQLAGSKTVRALTRLDADRILFAADDGLFAALRGASQPELLFRVPQGGRITTVVLCEHTLYVGTTDGSLFAFDLVFRRSQKLLAHERTPIHHLSIAMIEGESFLAIATRDPLVTLLHLAPDGDRLKFATGGRATRAAAMAGRCVAAIDYPQENLLIWLVDEPSRPPRVLDVHSRLGQHIQDCCAIKIHAARES